MTDLTKGIIEINGFEVGPNTTQAEFEQALGAVFFKKDNKYNSNLSTFYYNDIYGLYPNIPHTQHPPFCLNGMTFVDIVVDFESGNIRGIQLFSDLQSYVLDKEGRRMYSPEKESECFQALAKWSQDCWGTPNNDPRLSVCWNCDWGCFRPTPLSARGSDTSIFLVEYGRNYAL